MPEMRPEELKMEEKRADFKMAFDLALDLTNTLVQRRGEAEARFPEYERTKLHTKFKKFASVALNNPDKVRSLRTSFYRANYIMNNFKVSCKAPGEDSPDGALEKFKALLADVSPTSGDGDETEERPEEVFVPTLTFGDIIVPVRFANDAAIWNTESFERKYMKLHESNCKSEMLELITRVWGIDLPNAVFAFSGGKSEDIPEVIQKKFAALLYNFCKSVGVWIVSDGMHSGISRFIGRVFNTDLVPSAEDINLDFQREVSFFGVGDWAKLDDTTLLNGYSVEGEYSSYYFYPRELQLAAKDMPSMLNPFQNVYLLFQRKENTSMIEIRNDFLSQLQHCQIAPGRASFSGEQVQVEDSCAAGSSCKVTSVFDPLMVMYKPQHKVIPNATFVIGGDCNTLKQVRLAVKFKMPVIIVHKTGPIATSLVEIYWSLENIFPRSCVYQPDFTVAEDAQLTEMVNNDAHKCLFEGISSEDCLHNMKLIMRYRYFITILDFNRDRDCDFANVIQALYKPFKRDQCISIALETNHLLFLKTVFNREVDPEFDRGSSFVTAKSLTELHAVNLFENANLFEVKDLVSIKEPTQEIILPLVGRIIYGLLGHRYKLLYQIKGSKLDELLDANPHQQFWHLFLFCLLASKLDFAEFMLSMMQSPIGCALLAYKLLRYMSRLATNALESEKAQLFTTWSGRFEDKAVSIVDEMYQRSRRRAYVSINRELPNDFGPYITPLSMADDSHAMKFMGSSCCQTYLQRVWTKNMLLAYKDRFFMPFLALLPIVNLPFTLLTIKYEETEMPWQTVKEHDEDVGGFTTSVSAESKIGNTCGDRTKRFLQKTWWRMTSFHTAPVTKFNLSVISYCSFLFIISYFFLTELGPVHSARDISATEWSCYVWVLSLILEEVVQVIKLKETGPMHNLARHNISSHVWSFSGRSGLFLRLYRPLVYFQNGAWNAIDIVMLVFFVMTSVVRFSTPDEKFQLVRIFYGISIILFYFRTLRFLYAFRVIGPRIIAIKLMFVELMMFLVILLVFILSFGVAFQGLLHPYQQPSFTVLADILWRPYWSMFGQLYIDEGDVSGMGRDVGNTSCVEISSQDGRSHIECYSYMPIVLMAIYLFISNILLLNLLIAIFGNTLNKIEDSSELHWAFNQYNLVFENYYKPWLSPPFSLLCHFCSLCRFTITQCMCLCQKGEKKKGDADVSLKYPNDHFHMNSILDDTIAKEVDMAQKEAFAHLLRMESMAAKMK